MNANRGETLSLEVGEQNILSEVLNKMFDKERKEKRNQRHAGLATYK